MPQTRNIPQAKLPFVSQEEKDEAKAYHEVSDNLYHAGINVGKPGAYDPEAGHRKAHVERPESEPTPLLATDPGQPKGIKARELSRERSVAIDTPTRVGVPSGKKAVKSS